DFRRFLLPSLSLPMIAALTPEKFEVEIVDEAVETLDPEARADPGSGPGQALPGIGQEIQRRALGGELTRNQKAVAFESYFRAKTKILEQAEKRMKSDAQKTKKAILKAKTPQELARLGERMYKGQKEGKGDISPREWTILWKEYNRRKKELAPGLPRGKRQIRRTQAAGARIWLSITIQRAG
ncbi:MAG: hypothetical protein HY673_12465, partial [Chloroflexi bacterium]|nr:hypothetical protein [Chloroflexota bacterium]